MYPYVPQPNLSQMIASTSQIVLGWIFGAADREGRANEPYRERKAAKPGANGPVSPANGLVTEVTHVVAAVNHDVAIVAGLHRSEEEALKTLVMTYYEPLVRFATNMVRSVDVAEDIVQGMFCWLWEHRTSWAPANVRAYLYTATRRRVLNALDQDVVRNRLGALAMQSATEDVTRDNASDRTELVTDLVAELPEPQRTATRLRYQEGMTFAEIAAILRTSPVAVERMIQRAVARLRARYRGSQSSP